MLPPKTQNQTQTHVNFLNFTLRSRVPFRVNFGEGRKVCDQGIFCLFLYMNLQFFQHNLLRSLSVPFGLPLHPCQRQWTIFVQNYIFSLLFCSIYLCLLFVKPHCRHDCPFRVSLAKGNMSLPIFFFNSVQGILSPLSFQVDS
jgi:hypothetical protein